MSFQAMSYGPVFAGLLQIDRCRDLGPGMPNRSFQAALESLTRNGAFENMKVVDEEMADLCLSAVWLLHDFLDESHTISQGIETPDGSYWHGIMHRRERDYSNAKYWFRRVDGHPVFEQLPVAAREVASDLSVEDDAAELILAGLWNPSEFVDLCRRGSRDGGSTATLARRIQQREWELLFDHCFREAIGN